MTVSVTARAMGPAVARVLPTGPRMATVTIMQLATGLVPVTAMDAGAAISLAILAVEVAHVEHAQL